jgi:LPXTG-site transpeptidase (sortase) family protein
MKYGLLFCVSVSSTIVLTGCSFASSAAVNTPPLSVQISVCATPSPIEATPSVRQTPMLPEAGGTRIVVQRKATKLPATATATLPAPTLTVTPAQPAITNSPTSEGPAPAIPNRLLIPAIGLDAPIVAVGWSVVEKDGQQVSEWDVPVWRAAGWLNTSALIGALGNTVFEGHQDIAGRVFENLEYLIEGDEIQVQTASYTRTYVVALRTIVLEKNQPLEVRRENARWIGPSNDERLTLVTCWPRNDNTHRLILVALPAP